jgi:hypothetical protein
VWVFFLLSTEQNKKDQFGLVGGGEREREREYVCETEKITPVHINKCYYVCMMDSWSRRMVKKKTKFPRPPPIFSSVRVFFSFLFFGAGGERGV